MRVYAVFNDQGQPVAFFPEDVYGPRYTYLFGEAPEATDDDPAPVAPVLETRPNPAIPGGAIEISEEDHATLLANPRTARWRGGKLVEIESAPDPVPQPLVITDSQFFTQLALDGFISKDEAEATSDGTMPALIMEALDTIKNQDDRFKARMLVKNARTFERDHPLVALVAQHPALQWNAARLDKLWMDASKL